MLNYKQIEYMSQSYILERVMNWYFLHYGKKLILSMQWQKKVGF